MHFDVSVATVDFHPPGHVSFAKTHGKRPQERITVGGREQLLWPEHCVQGSFGAELAGGWDHGKLDKIIYKGTALEVDSYSAFFDNAYLNSTDLDLFLKARGIKTLYIAGLTTEYCVKFSVLDAIRLGYEVYLVVDACCAVDEHPGDGKRAIRAMVDAGAHTVSSTELMR
jgi:nicotinamidase/pyrazinamidase